MNSSGHGASTDNSSWSANRRPARQYSLSRDGLVCSGDRGSAVGDFRFMNANQPDCPIAGMARVLGVSKAGY